MSLGNLYQDGNKEALYSNVKCNSVDTKSLTFNGSDVLTTLSPPYLKTVKTIDQSIPPLVNTILTNYDSSTGSLNTDFNLTTGLFTAPVKGHYLLIGLLDMESASGANSRGLILVNGVVVAGSTSYATETWFYQSYSAVEYLNAGDVVALAVFQRAGVNMNVRNANLTVTQIGVN